MDKKPTLYWMIGISGSGKTSIANIIAQKTNAVILSSDDIRKELFDDENYQGDNKRVFEVLHNRIIKFLRNNTSVIYDATNIKLKERTLFFKQLHDKKLMDSIFNHAIVCCKSYNLCIKDNKKRDRQVPDDVIYKQVCQFNIPFFEEGFDKISLVGWDEMINIVPNDTKILKNYRYGAFKYIQNLMNDYNQNSKHHELTLKKHCDKTYDCIEDVYSEALMVASKIHDIGKILTKSIDEKNECHYYGHAEVGTYSLLQNLDMFNLLRGEILDVLFYINYHMYPFNWHESKTRAKYKKLFGIKKYSNLIILHNADLLASSD